ncbi:MAG: hypothetical protein ACREDU_00265 [Methylocella sp.]
MTARVLVATNGVDALKICANGWPVERSEIAARKSLKRERDTPASGHRNDRKLTIARAGEVDTHARQVKGSAHSQV